MHKFPASYNSLSLHGLNPLGGNGVRTGRNVFTPVTFSPFVHTVRAPFKILSVLTYVLPGMLSVSTYERTQMPRPYITEDVRAPLEAVRAVWNVRSYSST